MNTLLKFGIGLSCVFLAHVAFSQDLPQEHGESKANIIKRLKENLVI